MYEYSIKKIRHENIKVLNTEIKDKLGTYLTYLGHIINAIFSIWKLFFIWYIQWRAMKEDLDFSFKSWQKAETFECLFLNTKHGLREEILPVALFHH